MEKVKNLYNCNCNVYEYERLNKGDVFRHPWINDFIAPCDCIIYQLSRNNIFIKFVYMEV